MTTPFARIDEASHTPPFEQLKVQLIEAIRAERIAPGHKLPTVRGLAKDLGLAANTVARAYRELEHDHVIVTRGRSGSFIAATGDAIGRRAQEEAEHFALRMAELHIDADTAIDLARGAIAAREAQHSSAARALQPE